MADLWAGEFGDAYMERNRIPPDRRAFWTDLALKHPDFGPKVCEVGCGIGTNLKALRSVLQGEYLGIDVNGSALNMARDGRIDTMQRDILGIPGWMQHNFDGVLCVGVLIHVPPEELDATICAIFRLSKRYVFIGEYFAQDWEWIPYRGQPMALRKGPFDQRITGIVHKYPAETGYLTREDGFDRVTWWLYKV